MNSSNCFFASTCEQLSVSAISAQIELTSNSSKKFLTNFHSPLDFPASLNTDHELRPKIIFFISSIVSLTGTRASGIPTDSFLKNLLLLSNFINSFLPNSYLGNVINVDFNLNLSPFFSKSFDAHKKPE